jgi:hypothetical protein
MTEGSQSGLVIPPAIRRGRIARLDIYEVSESELDILERGSPESAYLNFAIFLISAAISFLTSIVTTHIESDRTYDVFVIVTVVGFVIGFLLLFLWGGTGTGGRRSSGKSEVECPRRVSALTNLPLRLRLRRGFWTKASNDARLCSQA